MDLHAMIEQACAEVGIVPPRDRQEGRWLKTDTLSGKNGKGDGRVKIDGDRVLAKNWQTGLLTTVRAGVEQSPADRRRTVERIEKDRRKRQNDADVAAQAAGLLMANAKLGTHPYLARKGFPSEKAHVITSAVVAEVVGRNRDGHCYLVPAGAETAIVIPASIRGRVTSCQLIWGCGTKKFLFGGEMGGATFRLAQGRDTWLCEGYATALSLRTVLRSMNRLDGVLVCFSAHNLAAVAPGVMGRVWVAADNDKPLDLYGGLGTGEHYARLTRKPYAMPPERETDINDMHQGHGVYAVQRLLRETIRGVAA